MLRKLLALIVYHLPSSYYQLYEAGYDEGFEDGYADGREDTWERANKLLDNYAL